VAVCPIKNTIECATWVSRNTEKRWRIVRGPADVRNKSIHDGDKCKTASPALLFPARTILSRE